MNKKSVKQRRDNAVHPEQKMTTDRVIRQESEEIAQDVVDLVHTVDKAPKRSAREMKLKGESTPDKRPERVCS